MRNFTKLALIGASLTLAADPILAQHKTGLEFQFDLRHEQVDEDSSVDGDRAETAFVTRRARWWLSGNMKDYSYKFRFKFKNGSVDLSYVKVGLKLSPTTKLTIGRDFDPLPISTATYNSRMSDAVIYSGTGFDKGDVGIQLENKSDGIRLRAGLANGAQKPWANGIDGKTQLTSFGFAADIKKTAGVFKPQAGFVIYDTPGEKIIEAGNPNVGLRYHGRRDLGFTVGTTFDFGATKVYLNAAQNDISKVEESFADGPRIKVADSTRARAYEARIAQTFTSRLDGSLHLIHNDYEVDGKKDGDAQRVSGQLFYYPYGHQKFYWTLSLIHKTRKRVGEKRENEKSVIGTVSARPSFVIAKN